MLSIHHNQRFLVVLLHDEKRFVVPGVSGCLLVGVIYVKTLHILTFYTKSKEFSSSRGQL